MKSTDRITTKYDTNMNKKSTLASLATLFMMLMLSASCSNSVSSSGLFGPLCDVYAQIAENNEKVSEAYEAANAAYKTKDKSKAQSLADEANSLAMETNEKNNALWDDAKKIAADMAGKPVPSECSAASGIKLKDCKITKVNTTQSSAQVFIEATPETQPADGYVPYFFLVDNDSNQVLVSVGYYSDGKLHFSFIISHSKGADNIRRIAEASKLIVVCQQEYKQQRLLAEGEVPTAAVDTNAGEPEPEPAYTGEEGTGSSEGEITADGVTFKKGALLAATLRKAKHITWDYNADFGVCAMVGNVMVVIDESEDLTDEGKKVTAAITSDIAPGIKFSVDYIKPSAVIRQVEKM